MPDLPKLLIIGDSISMGYMEPLRKELAGQFQVVHSPGNALDSDNVLAWLEQWLAADGDAAAVHVNCGLHDLKVSRETHLHQVPIDRYVRNLREILRRLRAGGGKVVWGRTTPVMDEWHQAHKPFDRRQRDVEAYNAAADGVMAEAGVLIDDLHGAIVGAGTEACLQADGVHMKPHASALLAGAVCRAVRGLTT